MSQRLQRAVVVEIAEQVPVLRVVLVAVVWSRGPMQDQSPGIGGKDLRFHVDMAAGDLFCSELEHLNR